MQTPNVKEALDLVQEMEKDLEDGWEPTTEELEDKLALIRHALGLFYA